MLLKITETRFDSEPICYFWINILFEVCVPHVHVNTLNYPLKRHLLPSYHGISRIPVDISRCTSCIRFKLAVTMVRKCGQTCGFTFTCIRHVIDENRFHNCVSEFYFYFRCQQKELLRNMRVENWIEQHSKQYSYLIQRFYSQLLRYN